GVPVEHRDGEVLDDGVGEQLVGDDLRLLLDVGHGIVTALGLGFRIVEFDLDALADPHGFDIVDAEAGQRPEHGLSLRVENLGFQHHVDHYTGHGRTPVGHLDGTGQAYSAGLTRTSDALRVSVPRHSKVIGCFPAR